MSRLRSISSRASLVFVFIIASLLTTSGQTANVRVTQRVDSEKLVTLRGNTHPLARPEYDQGAAPDSLPMERMLLVLQRSPQQETALRTLLDEQQIKASPNYHMWLTPEQFGEQFGPGPIRYPGGDGLARLRRASRWTRVAAGRTVIEFSGTAGALRQAYHTEMHKYLVNGEEHWANTSDPQIPVALQPRGGAALPPSTTSPGGPSSSAWAPSRAPKAPLRRKPLFTITGSNKQTFYAVGATDFATIYNVLPLWQASPAIDGTGQTIAIVGQTNIDLQDPHGFREIFLLPINDPTVILDGSDPGITEDETEADLDVEWSGAVAAGATIDLVVSASTETTAGIDLSSLYIIDNNLAPVMSESYGYCEQFLGTGGNAFYGATREQGAAQGITIINSSGDAGSARCDQSRKRSRRSMVWQSADWPRLLLMWRWGEPTSTMPRTSPSTGPPPTTHDTFVSALSYIPEMTWNDSCARTGSASPCAAAATDTPQGVDHTAGGGGQSGCVTSTGTEPQSPARRDIPNRPGRPAAACRRTACATYRMCRCLPATGLTTASTCSAKPMRFPRDTIPATPIITSWYFLAAGGTSAAAPAFAGIMALVNQKTGERQGNANYVLYPLAARAVRVALRMTPWRRPPTVPLVSSTTWSPATTPWPAWPARPTAAQPALPVLRDPGGQPPFNTAPAWTPGQATILPRASAR